MIDGYVKFFSWSVKIAIIVMATGHGKDAVMAMARLAAHAQLHDQMSYAKFSRALTGAQYQTTTSQHHGKAPK
jgi:hypothetical protein